MGYTQRTILLGAFAAVLALGQTQVKSPSSRRSQEKLTNQEKNLRAYIELMRSDFRKNKAEVVGSVMQLDADEAVKFWPIYKEFESEYAEFGNEVLALVMNYAANYEDMKPQIADQIANKLLDLEQERNNLKRKYYQRFKVALDPIAATRFLQVENQIERILDLQIASELPVIDASQEVQP